ncbi:MAG: ABC transporter ATP-binding protein [Gammaproteobacteria bacterium SHHR-1]|uniref:ABC transporter ATP-binding protein n=1 Tax=Magnetovirga frankeli TaxID=947516 RepID=UPI001292D306|nr:ABC transporter ATP-binding protein [gamma proteobacterium SS-5]
MLGFSDPPLIDLRDLSFRWRSNGAEVLALDRLLVQPGERVFIEGPSGSGKSTLLSLLAGMALPQRGQVRILGQDLAQLSGAGRDRFRAHHIGYIFQLFNLIPYLSIRENLILPCHFSGQRRARALQRSASLDAEAERLLRHLDLTDADLLGRPVTQLSVGQQQRVAAARALMGAPELLIADEPTSALDADRRSAFIQLLFNECRAMGVTLVFVSHDAALEPLFDRTLRLNQINQAGQDRRAN